MTKHTFAIAAGLGLMAATSFAGHEVVTTTGKDYKQPAPESCFKDRELQLDIFGTYADGNALDHAGPLQDHGWGGGLGLNYFFTRMIGVGVDAFGTYGRESRHGDDSIPDSKHTTVYNFTGSIIVRFAGETSCIAPYVFLGGGFHTDGDNWGSAHAGLGLEYRVVPQRIGIFADARWTYYGDRYGNGDQNNTIARAGVRFVF